MVGTQSASLTQPFSLILIDEAAQATEPDVLQVVNVALSSTGVHQIGDHKQLPATVSHPENKSDNNDISMFQRLLTSGLFPIVVLQVQHRMQEAIAAYPSQQFYADGLITATAPKGRTPHGFWWPSQDPVAFVNVRSSLGEQRGNNSTNSFYNSAEAKKVAQIVDEFQKYGGWLPSDIGVITAYANQVAEIQTELRLKKKQVAWVYSVDKAQGRECRLIIVSCVRSNDKGKLGFVDDCRRLNVAMTRAQLGFIMVGDYTSLTQRDQEGTWKPFFDFFGKRDGAVEKPIKLFQRPRVE